MDFERVERGCLMLFDDISGIQIKGFEPCAFIDGFGGSDGEILGMRGCLFWNCIAWYMEPRNMYSLSSA